VAGSGGGARSVYELQEAAGAPSHGTVCGDNQQAVERLASAEMH